jgi:hypothetical protein
MSTGFGDVGVNTGKFGNTLRGTTVFENTVGH